MVDTGAVQDQNGFEFGTIGVHERPHTTEITFAFFADIGDKQDGALRQDSGFVNGTGNRDEGGKTCAVIGNSWRGHTGGLAANLNVRAGWEDGIEVRCEHDDFFVVGAAKLANDVARGIDLHLEAGSGQQDFYGGGALCFLAAVWVMMARATPDGMRRRAEIEDEGRYTVLTLSVAAAGACARSSTTSGQAASRNATVIACQR